MIVCVRVLFALSFRLRYPFVVYVRRFVWCVFVVLLFVCLFGFVCACSRCCFASLKSVVCFCVKKLASCVGCVVCVVAGVCRPVCTLLFFCIN